MDLPEDARQDSAGRDITVYVARGTRVALGFYRRDDGFDKSLEQRIEPLHGMFARERIDEILVISYTGSTPGRGLRDFDACVVALRDPDEAGPPPADPSDVAGELIETLSHPHGGIVAAWSSRGVVRAADRADIAYAHAAMLEIAAARPLG